MDKRRVVIAFMCTMFCLLLLLVLVQSDDCGYVDKKQAAARIIENHNSQTGAKNAVTAVYLNYRLFDTLFEAMLLLLSAMAVISFSWRGDDEK